MEDEQDFLAAIRANPADNNIQLVFAEWLDERGRHLEAGFRRYGFLGSATQEYQNMFSYDYPGVIRHYGLVTVRCASRVGAMSLPEENLRMSCCRVGTESGWVLVDLMLDAMTLNRNGTVDASFVGVCPSQYSDGLGLRPAGSIELSQVIVATRYGHQIGAELVEKFGWKWDVEPPPYGYFGDRLLVDPKTGNKHAPHEAKRIQDDRTLKRLNALAFLYIVLVCLSGLMILASLPVNIWVYNHNRTDLAWVGPVLLAAGWCLWIPTFQQINRLAKRFESHS